MNMAAKLASLTEKGQLMVSDRYYKELKSDYALKSCGCENGTYTGEKKDIWQSLSLKDNKNFDFNNAYYMKTYWCENHGSEYANKLLKLDN
ncbi:MAG: hypothetical protein U5P10_09680 [Spirochaetia bacterium]|nr:hypothetical protein [Spirochaetia bacterium]